jgi:hypothetical protein
VPSGGGTEATRTNDKCFKALACTLDASYLAWSFVNSDTNWITIQNMVICCGETVLVLLTTTSSLPTTNYPHHIRIENNEIRNSTIYCVYTGHGQYNEFINNKIHDCGQQGVYATFRDSTFRGNEVYNVGTASGPEKSQVMQMGTSGNMTPTGNLIEENRFHNGPSDCLILYGTSNNIVRRNLVYSCSDSGLKVGSGVGDMDNSDIAHNTFYGNGNGLIISHSGSSGNMIRNNIAVGNIGQQISICSGCGTETTNLTTGVPTDIWTSPAGGSFTLKAGSAAIDRGTPIGLPFNGSAPDCGAIEFGAGSDITPPMPPQGLLIF